MIKAKLKKSFKDQIYRNIVSGWSAIFLMTIVGILLTPTILNQYGKEVYGIWFLIFNFIAYFYLVDFGFTSAITRLFASYNADKNFNTIKLISTAYLTIILIDIFLFVALLTFKDSVFSFLNIKHELYRLFTLLFYVGIFELVTQLVLRVNIGILKGLHRFDVAYRLEGMTAILRLVLVFWLLFIDTFDIVFFALIYSGSKIISDLISFAYIKEQLKGLMLTFDKQSFKDLIDLGSSSFLNSLAGVLLNSLPLLLFGRFFGVEEVFLYSIPFAVSIILTRFINAIYHGLTPKAAELQVFGERQKIFEISSFSVKTATLICFCALSFFIIFGEGVLYIWLGTGVLQSEEIKTMHKILLILLGFIFFETSQKPNIFVYKSVGLHWIVTTETFCSVIIFYISSICLYDSTGKMVFAWALLLVGVFKYCFYKFIGRVKVKTYSLPLITVVFTAIILSLLFGVAHIENAVIKIVALGALSITYVLSLFKYIFTNQEREIIVVQFSRLSKKLRW